jgi:hypothetical protein
LLGRAADLEVLGGIQEYVQSSDRAGLPAQFLNHLADGRSLPARFELDVQVTAVYSKSAPAEADFQVVRHHMGTGSQDGFEFHLLVEHPGKRRILGRLSATDDVSCILDGEETLRDYVKQISGDPDGQQRHHSRETLMAQHPAERDFIASKHGGEATLEDARDRSIRRIMKARAQESTAQHWRQRQRHQSRRQNRDADDNGKLVEYPSDHAAHEENWDEDGHQRDRHRPDGEGDLARAFESRFHWFSAGFVVRTMFSSITMASSTTNPTASVRASSETLLSEYPPTYMAPNVPTIDTGSASAGMMVADRRRTNR